MSVIEPRARLDALTRRWDVIVEQVSETETSYLAFGTRHAQPVVLKLARRTSDEWNAGEVLKAFGGRGVVRVHECDDGAVLLERATPGTSLATLVVDGRDEEATEILAGVIHQMSGGAPPPGCATVQQWGEGFERYLATGSGVISPALVEQARGSYVDLATSQRGVRLLHGDLHHDNVLSDAHRGWLSIDPKGVVGEVEYEIGALLRNPIGRPDLFALPATIERRVQRLARSLNLDVGRVLQWAFAQAVLSVLWRIEDGSSVDGGDRLVSFALTLRAMLA